MASVTAGWAALGHELFAAEGHTAVAAVTCFNADFCFVNEHNSVSSVLGEGCDVDCRGVARTSRYIGGAQSGLWNLASLFDGNSLVCG